MQQALAVAQAKEFVDTKEGGLIMKSSRVVKPFRWTETETYDCKSRRKKPEILILDDSASALDFATDAKLRMAIREMEGEMTVFIVSQRAASLQYADQIIVLDDGHIAGMGTHQELLQNCEVYQEIYYSQFKREAGGQA